MENIPSCSTIGCETSLIRLLVLYTSVSCMSLFIFAVSHILLLLFQMKLDRNGPSTSNIASWDFNCGLSVNSDEGFETKAPG